ncbi:MAG: F0F1 ATP synthase subunit B [Ruminococcus sp.]|nr:F0F1 ATP synthase subunit B [Ruminococcus sp.]
MLEFNFWTILFSVINILVLFLFLKKFLFGRINAILEERAQAVQADLDAARAEKEKAQQLHAEYEAAMAGAKEEARVLVMEAQKSANAQCAVITRQAQEEASRIVESTRRELELERARSVESAQEEIVSLALEAAAQVIGKEIDEESNRAIVDAFLADEEAGV